MTTAAKFNRFALRIASKMIGNTPDSCSIQRISEPDDGKGGWTESITTPVTGIPCRFSDELEGERVVADAQQGVIDGIVYLPATHNGSATGLRNKDRIVIAARGLEPVHTFEVLGFGPGEGVLISALVRKLEQ